MEFQTVKQTIILPSNAGFSQFVNTTSTWALQYRGSTWNGHRG